MEISTGRALSWSLSCFASRSAQEGEFQPRGTQMATKKHKPVKKSKKLRAGKRQPKVSTLMPSNFR